MPYLERGHGDFEIVKMDPYLKEVKKAYGKYIDLKPFENCFKELHRQAFRIKRKEAKGADTLVKVHSKPVEKFQQEVFMPGIGMVTFRWDINELKETMKMIGKDARILELPIEELIKFNTAEESVVLTDFEEKDEPIMVAVWEPLGSRPVVVDGNHRLFKKAKQGEKTISAYVFPGWWGMDEIDETAYRALNDVAILEQLFSREITEEEAVNKLTFTRAKADTFFGPKSN